MNTCDTCKWWGEEGSGYSGHNHRVCTNPKLASEMKDPQTSDELMQGYDAIEPPFTGPKFGCIHHEPK